MRVQHFAAQIGVQRRCWPGQPDTPGGPPGGAAPAQAQPVSAPRAGDLGGPSRTDSVTVCRRCPIRGSGDASKPRHEKPAPDGCRLLYSEKLIERTCTDGQPPVSYTHLTLPTI